MEIGFALCGSYCTYSQVFPILEILTRDYSVTPILSENAYRTDSRFGTAKEHLEILEELCGKPAIHTIAHAEPIGPKKLFESYILLKYTHIRIMYVRHSSKY